MNPFAPLTPELVAELPAGRDLDVLVAVKVFGYGVDPGLPEETAFYYPPAWGDLGEWPSSAGLQPEHARQYVPCYSTNLNEAWAIADHFSAKDHGKVQVSSSHYRGVHASISYGPGLDGEGSSGPVCGDTPEEALCRAALLAVLSHADPQTP